MRFRSLHAQSQSNRDFLGAFTLRQQLNDFALSRSETVASGRNRCARSSTLEVAFKHHGSNLRSEIRLVVTEGVDRSYQVPSCIRFQQETPSAGIEHLAHHLIGVMQS